MNCYALRGRRADGTERLLAPLYPPFVKMREGELKRRALLAAGYLDRYPHLMTWHLGGIAGTSYWLERWEH